MVFGENVVNIVIRARDQFSATFKSAQTQMMKFRKSGLILGAVGAAMAVGIGKAVVAANKVETGFAKVNTLLDKGQDSQQIFGDYVKETNVALGNQGSQLDVLDGLYQTISAGITDVNDAQLVMNAAVKGSVGGYAKQETVIKVLTKTMAAYGVAAEDAESVTDKLAGTVVAGQTTMEELGNAFPRVAGLAAEANVSLDEALGTFAGLTKFMGSSEEAGTSLAATIRSFIKPSEAMKKAVKALGYESTAAMLEQEGLNKSIQMLSERAGDISPIIKGVQTQFEQLTSNGMDAKDAIAQMAEESGKSEEDIKDMLKASSNLTEQLGELFPNVRALKAVLPLTGKAMEAVAGSMDIVADSTGLAQKQMEDAQQTFEYQWGQTLSNLQNLQTEFGDSLKTALVPVLEFLNPLIEKATELWNNLGEKWQGNIAIITVLTAVAFLLAGAIAIFLLIGWEVVLVALAIVAVIASVVHMFMTWRDRLMLVIKAFIRFVIEMEILIERISQAWEVFEARTKNVFIRLWKALVNKAFRGVEDIIKLMEPLIEIFNKLSSRFGGPTIDISGIKSGISKVKGMIGGAFGEETNIANLKSQQSVDLESLRYNLESEADALVESLAQKIVDEKQNPIEVFNDLKVELDGDVVAEKQSMSMQSFLNNEVKF